MGHGISRGQRRSRRRQCAHAACDLHHRLVGRGCLPPSSSGRIDAAQRCGTAPGRTADQPLRCQPWRWGGGRVGVGRRTHRDRRARPLHAGRARRPRWHISGSRNGRSVGHGNQPSLRGQRRRSGDFPDAYGRGGLRRRGFVPHRPQTTCGSLGRLPGHRPRAARTGWRGSRPPGCVVRHRLRHRLSDGPRRPGFRGARFRTHRSHLRERIVRARAGAQHGPAARPVRGSGQLAISVQPWLCEPGGIRTGCGSRHALAHDHGLLQPVQRRRLFLRPAASFLQSGSDLRRRHPGRRRGDRDLANEGPRRRGSQPEQRPRRGGRIPRGRPRPGDRARDPGQILGDGPIRDPARRRRQPRQDRVGRDHGDLLPLDGSDHRDRRHRVGFVSGGCPPREGKHQQCLRDDGAHRGRKVLLRILRRRGRRRDGYRQQLLPGLCRLGWPHRLGYRCEHRGGPGRDVLGDPVGDPVDCGGGSLGTDPGHGRRRARLRRRGRYGDHRAQCDSRDDLGGHLRRHASGGRRHLYPDPGRNQPGPACGRRVERRRVSSLGYHR